MASRRRAFTLSVLTATALVAAALPASQALAATTAAAGITIQIDTGGKCLNVAGASTANGTKVVQYTCTAAATNDHWTLVQVGNEGYYQVKSVGSGKCLTVSGASTANNAGLIIYTCTTGYNELWLPETIAGRPTVRLHSANTGKCLNVPGASTANNVQLVQYTCTAATAGNERVYFPPTTSPSPVARPITAGQAASVVQGGNAGGAAQAAVHFNWIDENHQLNELTYSTFDPYNDNTVASNWFATDGLAFTGSTSSANLADGRTQVVAHDAKTGDTFVSDEATLNQGDFKVYEDMGGTSATHPNVAADNGVSTHPLDVFTVTGGALWAAPELVNDPWTSFGTWRSLGGSGLTGNPVTAPANDGTGTQVFVTNSAGQIQTARYSHGTLTDWVNLGGTGLTGTPSVTTLTGYRQFLFSNTTSGTIVYKESNTDGSWPADWKSATGLTAVGNPTSVRQITGDVATVAARDAAGNIYYAAEPSEGSGTIGSWNQVSDPSDTSSQTTGDPTLYSYIAPSGQDFGISFYSKASVAGDAPWFFYFAPNTTYPISAAAAAKAKASGSAHAPSKKPALGKLENGKKKPAKMSLR